MTKRARRIATIQVLAASLLGVAAPVDAQYFGRNKVQYAGFSFEVLKTPHFDVYYYAREREAAAQAGRLAERWYARLSKILHHELRGRQPLILYASHPDFEQTNAVPGMLGEGTGGVTETVKRRIVLPLAGPLAETNHVIGHELVHAFQFDITGQEAGRFGVPGAARLPLWFVEGMAEYFSLGPVDAIDPDLTLKGLAILHAEVGGGRDAEAAARRPAEPAIGLAVGPGPEAGVR